MAGHIADPASRKALEQRDAADDLALVRDRFDLARGVIYLDGNSLGPPLKTTAARLAEFVNHEWRDHLVGGWRVDGWMDSVTRLGGLLAPMIGASANEVVVCDSTTINLYKLLHAALAVRDDRSVIVTFDEDFPTDTFVAAEVAARTGRTIRRISPSAIVDADFDDVAVVCVSHVHFRTGELIDMAAVTAAAHAGGAVMVWDLSHSAGALPVDLHGCAVDFAAGCTYKYLNGGPGAPAYCYVAKRWHDMLHQPIPGWLGHAQPFAFEPTYRPAVGVERLVTGTPHIASTVALETALRALSDVDLVALRRKSIELTALFIDLVGRHPELTVITPLDESRRGSQVALTHPNAYPIVQALIERGVIGDYRAPDVLRFGFNAAYVRYVDVFDAASQLLDVLTTGEWREPRFALRDKVT